MGEDEQFIGNKVLVCIIGEKFLLLREKWKHWNITEATSIEALNEVKLGLYLEKKDNGGELPEPDKWKIKPLVKPDDEADVVAMMEYDC